MPGTAGQLAPANVEVERKLSLITSIEFTLERPFAEFDEEKFKIALKLATGIDASQIRIASIRSGSTIVQIDGEQEALAIIIQKIRSSQQVAHRLAQQIGLRKILWEIDETRYELTVDAPNDDSELPASRPAAVHPFPLTHASVERQENADANTAAPAVETNINEVVLLLHGIRDFGEWTQMVSSILEEIPGTKVPPLSYGRFDAFRFWFPIWTREAPIRKLLWRIQSARDRFPTAKLSVIAHSFGTYAIGKILRENPGIRLHRLVLCGAILPSDFRWDQIKHSVETEIINDCGIKDIWPVLAQSTTFGYGPSGRFGFGTPGVRDRYHDFGHGGFFQEKFVSDFWLPWFRSGNFVKSKAPPPSGVRWHVLTIIQIKWLAILLCVLGISWLGIVWFQSFAPARNNFNIPAQTDDAEVVSKEFLSLLDKGRYGESWGMFHKGYMSQETWVQQCTKNQDQHGNLKERRLPPRDVSYPLDIENAPRGQYAIMRYDSSFEKFPEATETVILRLNSEGHWKIWSYHWEAQNPSPSSTPTSTVTTPTATLAPTSQPKVTASSTQVPAAYNTGNAYFDSRQYDLAISEFDIAETESPTFAMTYLMRGMCWYFKHEYTKAIPDFTRFTELEPTNVSGFWQRGLCFFESKDYKKAIADFSKTIEIDVKNGSAYYQRGLSYLAIEDTKQALADFTKAMLGTSWHATSVVKFI